MKLLFLNKHQLNEQLITNKKTQTKKKYQSRFYVLRKRLLSSVCLLSAYTLFKYLRIIAFLLDN